MAPANSLDDLRRRIGHGAAPGAFAALAEEHRRAGRFDDAVAVCREGLAHYPTYVSARVTLGRALLDMGDVSAAVEELQQAVAQAPDNLAASRALASAEALMPADFPYPGADASPYSLARETVAPPLFEPPPAAPVTEPLDASQTLEAFQPFEALEAVEPMAPIAWAEAAEAAVGGLGEVGEVAEVAEVAGVGEALPSMAALVPAVAHDTDAMAWLSPQDATTGHTPAVPDWPGPLDVDPLDDSTVTAFVEEQVSVAAADSQATPAAEPTAWDETIYAPIMPLPVWPEEPTPHEQTPDELMPDELTQDEPGPQGLAPDELTASQPTADVPTLDEAVEDEPLSVPFDRGGFGDAGPGDGRLGDATLGDWAALPPEAAGGDWSGSVDAVLAEVFAKAGGDDRDQAVPSPLVDAVAAAPGASSEPLVASLEALLAAIRRRRADLASAHSGID